jgi:membrane fusion protein, copper/silver efflux system
MTSQRHDEMPEGEERPPAGVRSMAIVRWVIVCVMALAAAVSVLSHYGVSFGSGASHGDHIYYCPMHPQIVQDHPGECPICNMTLVLKPPGPVKASATMAPPQADGGSATATGKYYCPMHPHVSSDDPNAKCDLCGGMKLVPRPATPPAAAAGVPGLVPVDLAADRVQLIGVKTAKVERRTLARSLTAIGAVAANERGLAQIAPRFSGWVERLLVEETGKRVARGQVVATIYSPELLQAQQELISALGWAASPAAAPSKHAGHSETANDLVADARHRLELLGISRQEIDAIAKERRPRRAIELRSPVEGHVVVKNAVVGMAVQPGVPLFEVADLSSVWIVAEVYESDANRVRLGQPATFQTNTYPGETFPGKIQFVYPSVESSSRTLRLRLEVKNRPGPGGLKLRPGMFGTVALDLPASDGLTVPAQAIVDTGESQYVFVDRGGGRYEPRRVQVGARAGEKAVVIEGLAPGEVVVTTSNFLIDSESRLRAAIDGQGSAPSSPKEATSNPSGAAPMPPGHRH